MTSRKIVIIFACLIAISCVHGLSIVLAGAQVLFRTGYDFKGVWLGIIMAAISVLPWIFTSVSVWFLAKFNKLAVLFLSLAIITGELLPTTYLSFIPFSGHLFPSSIYMLVHGILNFVIALALWICLTINTPRGSTVVS